MKINLIFKMKISKAIKYKIFLKPIFTGGEMGQSYPPLLVSLI